MRALETRFLEKLDSELIARKETEKRLMTMIDQRIQSIRGEVK